MHPLPDDVAVNRASTIGSDNDCRFGLTFTGSSKRNGLEDRRPRVSGAAVMSASVLNKHALMRQSSGRIPALHTNID